MTPKVLLVACVALLAGTSPGGAAQEPPDPITGTWTGHMGRSATERQNITMTLRLEGHAVTGRVTGPPRPGEIRTGTFDPASGRLRLEIVVQDDAKTIAVFEGRVEGDSAAGQVSIGGQTGSFSVSRGGAGAGAGGGRAAPAGHDAAIVGALLRSFAEVSDYVTKSAELVPADKYGYRPADTVRTYGQLIAHIADGYAYYCAAAGGREAEWTDAVEKGNTDKATLVAALKKTTAACQAAHETPASLDAVIGNIAHTNLHYGNLVTYIRLLGLVPPSS